MKYVTIQEIRVAQDLCEKKSVDHLMEALLDLETVGTAVADPDLAADLSVGRVDVQMIVDADDPAGALCRWEWYTRSSRALLSQLSGEFCLVEAFE